MRFPHPVHSPSCSRHCTIHYLATVSGNLSAVCQLGASDVLPSSIPLSGHRLAPCLAVPCLLSLRQCASLSNSIRRFYARIRSVVFPHSAAHLHLSHPPYHFYGHPSSLPARRTWCFNSLFQIKISLASVTVLRWSAPVFLACCELITMFQKPNPSPSSPRLFRIPQIPLLLSLFHSKHTLKHRLFGSLITTATSFSSLHRANLIFIFSGTHWIDFSASIGCIGATQAPVPGNRRQPHFGLQRWRC
ncbi:hypothetical protein N658DRAFT_100827 [Parathielavia hyrcaniae]|uniref:Uncharacterized protein n=1 Tax=Parathielavia hyrcaniae TaxID=113614 RepID=A0AAN6Q052_9PEZI|nr:hypothetical protein N658DRAFT_100827 [Parathielavia hyrcaniae]